MSKLPRTELLGQKGHWLLDLDLGGHIKRFATATLLVTSSATGESLLYEKGLPQMELPRDVEGGVQSVPITIAADVDWAALFAKGVALDGRSAVLRRWYTGQTLEQAIVFAEGLTAQAEFEELGDPLTFSLEPSERQQARVLPSAQMVVDATTWPVRVSPAFATDEKILGAHYPIIIGTPGKTGGGVQAVAPAYLVEQHSSTTDSRVLIAGHEIYGSNARLFDFSADPPDDEQRPVSTMEDGLGRTISYVDFQSSSLTQALGTEYYVGFGSGSGGVPNATRTGPLEGLGEVLQWALRTHTDINVDTGRMDAWQEALDVFKVAAVINNPINMWAWVQQVLLASFPVTQVSGPDGMFFLPWRFDATVRDATVWLDATSHTGNVQRVSSLRFRDWEVYNRITVEFQPERVSGGFRDRRIVTGGADSLLSDSRVLRDYRCTLSQQGNRFGVRDHVIKASGVWDDATAVRMAKAWAAKHALPKLGGLYQGGPDLEAVALGDIVVLTDPGVYITNQLAVVQDQLIGPDQVVLDLTLLGDPAQQTRLTS